MKTAEQIYREVNRATDTIRGETIAINKAYRVEYGTIADKAIRKAREQFNRLESLCCGLEYCYEIENQLTLLANKDY